MQLARPAFALDPRRFGRGPVRSFAGRTLSPSLAGDLKLFATTFIAGFVFVSVLIA
jgi:hypothetical protein